MKTGVIIFIVVYCLALVCYFFTETRRKEEVDVVDGKCPNCGNDIYRRKYKTDPIRAINKCFLALAFVVFAIVMFLTNKRFDVFSFDLLLVIAIILAALGDVFLLFSLQSGLDFFLAGNIGFIAYETALLTKNGFTIGNFFWIYLVSLVMVSVLGVCIYKFPNFFKHLDKKLRKPVIFYASSIFTHGMTGLAVVILCPKTMPFLLLGLGSFLFMLSDVDITFNKFVCPNNKWVLRLNSALYFTGLLMIVLSMSY